MDTNNKEPLFIKIRKILKSNIWNILWLVALCTIIIFAVWNWGETLSHISRFISILTPFVIAVFLAYLISPLITALQTGFNKLLFHEKKKKLNFVISIILSYLIVLGVITITIIYIVPEIGKSIREMDIPVMYESAIKNINELQDKFPFLKSLNLNKKIQDLQPMIWKIGTEKVFPAVFVFSKSIVTTTINIVLSIVISCYIIIDKENLVYQFKRIIFAFVSKKKAPLVWNTMKECNHIFNGFLIGKTIDSLIIGILCFILMTIFHFPYAILISVIVGITNMIPYFGPFIGAVPGVVIYLITDPKLSFFFALLILALQQFDGLYLGPKILGDLTGLKPLWVIFAITVGGAYFGVLGMFLGVPVVAVIAYLFNMLITKKLKARNVGLK